MSVTFASGFRAAGVAAGIKSSGKPDLALVVSDGPDHAIAGVFTSNRVTAAPVVWSRAVVQSGTATAVVLNSGGANACTGQRGHADAAAMAQATAEQLGVAADQVAVCSTGLIGVHLPMGAVIGGIGTAASELEAGDAAGANAARAIMTTDSVSKTATFDGGRWRIGGMAKGAGMLAPGLATMLVVITTDAQVPAEILQSALAAACARTFDRVDSDGCMSTNDTVLLMASGASGYAPEAGDLLGGLLQVCESLARQLQTDAEGSTKDIDISVVGAASEADAVTAARAIARSSLLKCAIHGEDPNWGRILAAVGTTDATFDGDDIDVCLNGVWVCRQSQAADDRTLVKWPGREVSIVVDLKAGSHSATVRTNDLTAMYVHENSAYSS